MPVRCCGRDLNLLLDVNDSRHLGMKFAEILEVASLHERMLSPLDLELSEETVLRRAATPGRRPLRPQFLSGVSSWA